MHAHTIEVSKIISNKHIVLGLHQVLNLLTIEDFIKPRISESYNQHCICSTYMCRCRYTIYVTHEPSKNQVSLQKAG